MRLDELTFRPNQHTRAMSDEVRHEWLKFIYHWLSGTYMHGKGAVPQTLDKWQALAQMFPPKVPSQVTLFRLVTVPIAYASKRQFSFRPAPAAVSSWTSTLVGLDAVAGVAKEMAVNQGTEGDTARLGIEATIPGSLVLATPQTIRAAFMTMSHDYFDRYQEEIVRWQENGRNFSKVTHPGYPGGDQDPFSMDEVGYMQDVLSRRGGHLRQYEYIVQSPARVDATVVQIYRIGYDTKREGNDDPNFPPGAGFRSPRITRMK